MSNITHNFVTHNLSHTIFRFFVAGLVTSTLLLPGRRGTYSTGLALVARLVAVVPWSFCVADVALCEDDSMSSSCFLLTHTQLFHTAQDLLVCNSFTNFHTPTELYHTNFVTHTHNFVTYNSFTHIFVTHNSFTHTSFACNYLEIIDPPPSPLVLMIRRRS